MKKLLVLAVYALLLSKCMLYSMDIKRWSMADMYQFHKKNVETFFDNLEQEIKQLSPKVQNISDEETQEKARTLLKTLTYDSTSDQQHITEQLKDMYQKSKGLEGYSAKLAFHNQAQNLQEQIFNALSAELTIIRNLVMSDERSREYDQYKKQLDRALAAKQKARTFFSIVQRALPLLKDIQVEMRKSSVAYLTTKSIEAQKYETTIKQYLEAARLISEGYKQSGISPDFNDRDNIARIAYNRFLQSCVDDIAVTHNVMQRLFKEYLTDQTKADTYTKQFFALQRRLFGDDTKTDNDQGYSALARNMTQTLFNQKASTFQDQFWNQIQEIYSILTVHFLRNCVRMHLSWNENFYKTFNTLQMVFNHAKTKETLYIKQAGHACITVLLNDVQRLLKEVTLQDMLKQLSEIKDLCNQAVSLASRVGLDQPKIELKGIIATIEQLVMDKKEADRFIKQDPQKAQKKYQEIQRVLALFGGQPVPASLQVSLARVQGTISPDIQDMQEHADALMKKGSYKEAAEKYQAIVQELKKTGDTEKQETMEKNYLQALSKALVIEYMQNVLPNAQDAAGIKLDTIGNLAIPQQYKLVRFVQPVPQDVAEKYQDASSERLINLASYLRARNQLKIKGIDISAVFDDREKAKKLLTGLSAEQQDIVQSILKDAQDFKGRLQENLTQDASTISLESKQDPTGVSHTSLVITHFSVFPVTPISNSPLTPLAYPGYPTAQRYFAWAQKFADPANKKISYGQLELPSANMPDKAKQLNLELGKAFLSAANSIDRRINFITQKGSKKDINQTVGVQESNTLDKSRDLYQKVTELKNAQTVQLKDYIFAYQTIQSYINDAQITYYVAAEDFVKKAGETSIKFDQLESDAYQKLGDSARTFLIGNPQDALYLAGMRGVWSGVLADVMNYYKLAYGLVISKQNDLLKKIVDAVNGAGTVLVNEQKLLASKRYYEIAIGAALSIKPQDTSVLNQASLGLLHACYGGVVQLLTSFRTAYVNPVVVEYQEGKKATFTFEKFVERIVTCPSPDVNKFECQIYEKQRTQLLDALVYIQEGYSWAGYLKNPQAADHPHTVKNADDQKKDTKNQMVQDFMKKWNITFDSLDDTKRFLMRKDFTDILNDAYQEFKNMLLKDDKNRQQAFEFFSQWNNKLFLAFIYLYGDWYLKGAGSLQERFTDVLQLIKLEHVNILAPAEQWIG